jgi:peptidoglycan/LPS O-acetylase OafA/YrhL
MPSAMVAMVLKQTGSPYAAYVTLILRFLWHGAALELEERVQRFMAEPKPGTGRYYRPELDVVRLIAFMLVFISHELPSSPDSRIDSIFKGFTPILYAISTTGRFGLSLFFTLSAFLICELLLRERATAGAVSIKQFYIRRILRIWPLYYLGVAIGVAVALLPGGYRGDIVYMGWYSIFMSSWYLITHGGMSNPMLPLWSISVEEQFYLLAPWIVKYFNRKSLYGFCAVTILVANVWIYYLGNVKVTRDAIWYNPFVQFECFAAGILLCLVLRGRLPKLAVWHRLMLVAGSYSCWFYASYTLHTSFDGLENPGSWPLISGYALASLGSVLILIAFLGVSPKVLPGWAIYLGRISFGLYVYHAFGAYLTSKLLIGHLVSFNSPIYLLKGVLALGLTVLLAAVSYRYFETPFLKMKKRHAVIESQPVG